MRIQVADVDEGSVTHPDPAVNVAQTARLKAEAVAATAPATAVVIAADTTVALGNEMLNKPADAAAARAMLRHLRGRSHRVHTGIAAIEVGSGRLVTEVATTTVVMRPYGDDEIDAYVASGDPLDKAGAYAIQHPGFRPVARLQGCYTCVVGLSLCRLANALRCLGLTLNLPVATATHNYRECATCLALLAHLPPLTS